MWSVSDRDHGGTVGAGNGTEWARKSFSQFGLATDDVRILLLTQPKVLGAGFNPVSFWLAIKDEQLLGVIAEVNNTYGDRHSYVCLKDDFGPLSLKDELRSDKVMHVSPFQDVAGEYSFNFALQADRFLVRICHKGRMAGVVATLSGEFCPMTNLSILSTFARRPLAPFRTLALIHWQALKLYLKGVSYRARPSPPKQEVS